MGDAEFWLEGAEEPSFTLALRRPPAELLQLRLDMAPFRIVTFRLASSSGRPVYKEVPSC